VNFGGGAMARPPHRVCFFGTYARAYTVTRLLLQACRAAGIEVVECHQPLWEKTPHKTAVYFGGRSLSRLLWQYLTQARALSRQRRAIGPVSLYLVGFNGQLDCLLLRAALHRHPAPLVFAPLVTVTETLIEDRAVFRQRSARTVLARWLDRASLHAATHVVIDAEAHRRYVIEQFAVAPQRVSTWHLGADPQVFTPTPPQRRGGPMQVLFYGSFLPLHGVRTVLDAAVRLRRDRDIEFILLGDGPERAAHVAYARAEQLENVRFLDWVPYETLGRVVAAADVCLGIFGSSAKAQMVIPNKMYQAAMVGRPVITADTPAVREVFAHGATAWMCPAADADALAGAIRTMGSRLTLRQQLGQQAAALMAEQFSPAAQAHRLADILARAMSCA
jgi:glycosyltransferase involved in cell wall biosynthesis